MASNLDVSNTYFGFGLNNHQSTTPPPSYSSQQFIYQKYEQMKHKAHFLSAQISKVHDRLFLEQESSAVYSNESNSLLTSPTAIYQRVQNETINHEYFLSQAGSQVTAPSPRPLADAAIAALSMPPPLSTLSSSSTNTSIVAPSRRSRHSDVAFLD